MKKHQCWDGGTWGVSEDGIKLPWKRTVPTRGASMCDEAENRNFEYKIDIII